MSYRNLQVTLEALMFDWLKLRADRAHAIRAQEKLKQKLAAVELRLKAQWKEMDEKNNSLFTQLDSANRACERACDRAESFAREIEAAREQARMADAQRVSVSPALAAERTGRLAAETALREVREELRRTQVAISEGLLENSRVTAADNRGIRMSNDLRDVQQAYQALHAVHSRCGNESAKIEALNENFGKMRLQLASKDREIEILKQTARTLSRGERDSILDQANRRALDAENRLNSQQENLLRLQAQVANYLKLNEELQRKLGTIQQDSVERRVKLAEDQAAAAKRLLETERQSKQAVIDASEGLSKQVRIWQERALTCGWTDLEAEKTEYTKLVETLKKENPGMSDVEIASRADVVCRFQKLELD